MRTARQRWLLAAQIGLPCLGLLLVGAGIPVMRTLLKPAEPAPANVNGGRPHLVEDRIFLPPETVQSLGVRIEPARRLTQPPELPPLTGSLAIDLSRLALVNSRFAGDVVALQRVANEVFGPAVSHLRTVMRPWPGFDPVFTRPLRFGDKVRKGDLLAVVRSKELGEKKSELVDALSQERLDRDTL